MDAHAAAACGGGGGVEMKTPHDSTAPAWTEVEERVAALLCVCAGAAEPDDAEADDAVFSAVHATSDALARAKARGADAVPRFSSAAAVQAFAGSVARLPAVSACLPPSGAHSGVAIRVLLACAVLSAGLPHAQPLWVDAARSGADTLARAAGARSVGGGCCVAAASLQLRVDAAVAAAASHLAAVAAEMRARTHGRA